MLLLQSERLMTKLLLPQLKIVNANGRVLQQRTQRFRRFSLHSFQMLK